MEVMADYRSWRRAFAVLALCLTLGAPGLAAETWSEVRTPNFTVFAQDEGHAMEAARQLEELRAAISVVFPSLKLELDRPLWILASHGRDRATIKRYSPLKGCRVQTGTGTAKAEGRHYLIRPDRRHSPLELGGADHRYGSLIIDLNFDFLPPWLDEGLAGLIGQIVVKSDRVELGNPSLFGFLAARLSNRIPMREFLNPQAEVPQDLGKWLDWRSQSWALTNYALTHHDEGERALLTALLARLSTNISYSLVHQSVFGDLRELEDDLDKMLGRNALKVRQFRHIVRVDPSSFLKRNLTRGEASAVKILFLTAGCHLTDAQEQLEEAAESDGPALLHQAAGQFHYARGELQVARKDLQRALQLEPSDWISEFYLGLISEQEDGLGQAAEEHFKRCLEGNPRFVPALEILARLKARQGQMDEAIGHARQALQIMPSRAALRLDLSRMLLQAGRTEEATVLAQRLLARARQTELRDQAREVLEAITAKKNAGSEPD